MRAGRLRYVITIERRVDVQQDGGDVVFDYEPIGQDFAAIEDLSARELALVSQIAAEATTRIRLRWRDDVDETCRIVHQKNGEDSPAEEDFYDIAGPPMADQETGRREMILLCIKRRAEGYRLGPEA